jgi:hypothetical protein
MIGFMVQQTILAEIMQGQHIIVISLWKIVPMRVYGLAEVH